MGDPYIAVGKIRESMGGPNARNLPPSANMKKYMTEREKGMAVVWGGVAGGVSYLLLRNQSSVVQVGVGLGVAALVYVLKMRASPVIVSPLGSDTVPFIQSNVGFNDSLYSSLPHNDYFRLSYGATARR